MLTRKPFECSQYHWRMIFFFGRKSLEDDYKGVINPSYKNMVH